MPNKTVAIRIDNALLNRVNAFALEAGHTRSNIIRLAVEWCLNDLRCFEDAVRCVDGHVRNARVVAVKATIDSPVFASVMLASRVNRSCLVRIALRRFLENVDANMLAVTSYACPICGKTFATMRLLREHIISEHIAGKDGYRCPVCGRVFSSPDGVIRHAMKAKDPVHRAMYEVLARSRATWISRMPVRLPGLINGDFVNASAKVSDEYHSVLMDIVKALDVSSASVMRLSLQLGIVVASASMELASLLASFAEPARREVKFDAPAVDVEIARRLASVSMLTRAGLAVVAYALGMEPRIDMGDLIGMRHTPPATVLVTVPGLTADILNPVSAAVAVLKALRDRRRPRRATRRPRTAATATIPKELVSVLKQRFGFVPEFLYAALQ